VTLDRQYSGFHKARGGPDAGRWVGESDAFYVLGRNHERSVVTGRLADDVMKDERVERFVGRQDVATHHGIRYTHGPFYVNSAWDVLSNWTCALQLECTQRFWEALGLCCLKHLYLVLSLTEIAKFGRNSAGWTSFVH
jgi:hypothetical protein